MASLNKAAAGAQADTRRGAAAMIGVRSGSNVRVLTRQQQQKAADEAARAKVVADIEQIYSETKERVEQKLANLDTEVGAIFDQGTDAALNAMTAFVDARLDAYKDDRYSGILGKGRWIRDQFRGLPHEVDVFYEQGRQVFQQRMDALVVRVAALVERRLKEAKDEVAKGQARIKDFVAKQPKSLQDVAKKAQQDVSSRFAELERGIEDKKNQLAQALAAKYKEAFNKANEALQKIQDANAGLVAGFIGKLVAVVKALLEFKDKLMSILRKGVAAIKLIIADPIGFLSNLISAVAGGIRKFVANIEKHMIEGFKQWLFGSLGGLGVEVPRDLSLPSILKLVLSVLGITYDRIREKAVRLLGERNMRLIEKLGEYLRTLVDGGPAALWEKVKEDLGNLKEMVIDAIKNYVIETAAKQGMARIVALFNPAGAIIAAIMAIYNIIMFVVEKAAQIAAFVESVVDSIYDIASGNISGAIDKVEASLARAIPLLLGFLARFAGLGNITEKIQEFIKKVQDKVDAAIDKALVKIVAFVKKTLGKLTGKEKDKPDDRTPEQKQADLHRGIAEADQLLQRRGALVDRINASLPAIRDRYKLASLALVKDGVGRYHVHGTVNPDEDSNQRDVAEVVDIPLPNGATVKAAKLGSAYIPIDKILIYGAGKVQFPEKSELEALRVERRTDQRTFAKTPGKKERIKELEKKEHNFERSADNLRNLQAAGMSGSIDDAFKITLHLLEQAKSFGALVTVGQSISHTSRVDAPSGPLVIDSRWKIQQHLASGEIIVRLDTLIYAK